jgi:hypothetical protein
MSTIQWAKKVAKMTGPEALRALGRYKDAAAAAAAETAKKKKDEDKAVEPAASASASAPASVPKKADAKAKKEKAKEKDEAVKPAVPFVDPATKSVDEKKLTDMRQQLFLAHHLNSLENVGRDGEELLAVPGVTLQCFHRQIPVYWSWAIRDIGIRLKDLQEMFYGKSHRPLDYAFFVRVFSGAHDAKDRSDIEAKLTEADKSLGKVKTVGEYQKVEDLVRPALDKCIQLAARSLVPIPALRSVLEFKKSPKTNTLQHVSIAVKLYGSTGKVNKKEMDVCHSSSEKDKELQRLVLRTKSLHEAFVFGVAALKPDQLPTVGSLDFFEAVARGYEARLAALDSKLNKPAKDADRKPAALAAAAAAAAAASDVKEKKVPSSSSSAPAAAAAAAAAEVVAVKKEKTNGTGEAKAEPDAPVKPDEGDDDDVDMAAAAAADDSDREVFEKALRQLRSRLSVHVNDKDILEGMLADVKTLDDVVDALERLDEEEAKSEDEDDVDDGEASAASAKNGTGEKEHKKPIAPVVDLTIGSEDQSGEKKKQGAAASAAAAAAAPRESSPLKRSRVQPIVSDDETDAKGPKDSESEPEPVPKRRRLQTYEEASQQATQSQELSPSSAARTQLAKLSGDGADVEMTDAASADAEEEECNPE